MNTINKSRALVFLLGLVAAVGTTCQAFGWTHYHGGGFGYVGPGYYGPPGYYPGWGGPNVIINVPIVPAPLPIAPYVRECETVEVCTEYDECWLERQCR